MSRHVNTIAGRLSLRPPQRESLEILDRVTGIVPPSKETDVAAALEAIRSEYPSVTDFEREFPSLCFALATGVGKTRLMGAFISYLHIAHGIRNFFVLAPNLTIYNKLITDFTPNTPKYVFQGIAEFAAQSPEIITGDNYEQRAGLVRNDMLAPVSINIFNISKINSEVRGGKSPRIKRLSEYIGESYFAYLAGLPDLVLLMDESHRYRASAGVKAINELQPILGLELTATPFVETNRRGGTATPFKNIIYDYPLGRAMEDGFVKEPAVVTRKDFNPAGMADREIERLKLEDGIRLHENVKVELETYARQTGRHIVKPFLLVIARDTTHAGELLALIQDDAFFDGRYRDKVIQVDSSKTGKEEEAMVERLLRVEHADEPTEIVIHVNMLKEGWDVTNLYTIVPLRAANARTLIEQSIGRGLRLPYGKRTGVSAVDTLNIVAHDRFNEIVNEASRGDSPIHIRAIELGQDDFKQTVTVISRSRLASQLGLRPTQAPRDGTSVSDVTQPAFSSPEDQKVAQLAYQHIRNLENQPDRVKSVSQLRDPEIRADLVREVAASYQPDPAAAESGEAQPDIKNVVARTAELVVEGTIDIPTIQVVPRGDVRTGFNRFQLDLAILNYPAVSDELWQQQLRTQQGQVLDLGESGATAARLEDYIVDGLVQFNDISYDKHADLLYDLAGQAVEHFRSYLAEDEAVKVLRCYQQDIARLIHAQMQEHYWEQATDYEVHVSRGFTALKESAYTTPKAEKLRDFRKPVPNSSQIGRYVFNGFERCLYELQKFQSEPERQLAVILDREAERWFRPARGQFRIYYHSGGEHPEYQPDFVAETADAIFMLESKARNEMDDPVVLAKRDAAVEWCRHASDYSAGHGGKPWRYLLVPHDEISTNMTLKGLAKRFVES